MISINKNVLYLMFRNAANILETEYEYINQLNVFPVPDGDTGSNMITTLKGALEEIHNVEEYSLYEFSKKFSRSLLMNAHGNSGVILSQILKGFFNVITKDTKAITTDLLIDAFSYASEAAYKVVDNPKEGTMLTVIRIISEKVNEKRNELKTIQEVFKEAIFYGDQTVEKTTDMIPVLKKAKVVDSGAYGLMLIIKGMYEGLLEKNNKNEIIKEEKENFNKVKENYEHSGINSDFIFESKDGYGYCCEFILEINADLEEDKETKKIKFDKDEIIKELNKVGNSLVVVNDEIFCKVHIHSLNPHKVLEIGQKYGEFHKIKIENMTLQKITNDNKNKDKSYENRLKKTKSLPSEPKLIATVPNEKINKLLITDFNVAATINRENNQNPSVQDFLNLINKANSSKIILVIDNQDCYLAANQAIQTVTTENKDVHIGIITCNNILQSIIAILNFNKFDNFLDIIKTMNKSIKKINTMKIATAAKNTKTSNLKINKGDFILIKNKQIISKSNDLFKLSVDAIDFINSKMKHNKNNTLFLILNSTITNDIKEKINEYVKNKHQEYEIIEGGNDVYLMYVGA